MRPGFAFSVVAAILLLAPRAGGADKVIFDRDVRPILADKCFACHGPDVKEAKGDLRLDLRDSAVRKGADSPIVPGHPDKSELIRRITSDDETERMPPPDSHKELTSAEKQALERWIADGAEYTDHWSFIAPQRPALPRVRNPAWVRNEIDRFILARLEGQGMEPSPEADRATLVRRVSLDLRGLPPTLAEIDEYLQDAKPGAYERMVDRVLASPHYGEKLGLIWMDLARYGDTSGYHLDSTRDSWPWRDWVIHAYNTNMPFDRFSIEQLGGDLLPGATLQQKIASGFNRNARFNEEGGADPDEWLVRYAVDRTITLGRVWLGLTLNCAECHSHKYDPVSQKEFYQLYAFFNSLEEVGAGGETGFHRKPVPPFLRIPSPEQQRLQDEIAQVERRIKSQLQHVAYRDPGAAAKGPAAVDEVWIDDDLPKGAMPLGDSPWQFVSRNKGPVFRGEKSLLSTAVGLGQHFFEEAANPLTVRAGDRLFAYVYLDPANPPREVMLQWRDAQGQWEHRAYWGKDHAPWGTEGTPSKLRIGPLPKAGAWARLEVAADQVGLSPGSTIHGWAFTQFSGKAYWDAAGKQTGGGGARQRSLAAWRTDAAKDNGLPQTIRKLLALPTANLTAQQQQEITDYYVEHVCADSQNVFAPLHARLAELQGQKQRNEAGLPAQMISVELATPRRAFVLLRGDFQKPGDQVQRGVPAILPPLPADGPRNRLTLARSLFDRRHPLTARVTVNRLWGQVFGRGIVETIGDFGRLGRYPTHPELLDWLAVEFADSGWDTKHMFRLILNSAAYRQSSVNRHRYDEADPYNLLLSRSPRYRLMAEEIRDGALRTSGLLNEKIGGPPVFPYQPPLYYAGKNAGWKWDLSAGEEGHRRGMYTFWRRTTPYPTFVIFDAPDRSECVVDRPRTNTPLQALATMNEPLFVEAAKVFAQNTLKESPADVDGKLAAAFRRATARRPNAQEARLLRELLDRRLAFYRKNPSDAAALTAGGDDARGKKLDAAALAAWINVTNAILNLDECIMRE